MRSLSDFKNGLKETVEKQSIDFFLIHTEGNRAPFRPEAKKASAVKKEYAEDLESLTFGRNYSLVCFNYDYLKTGIYSVRNSVCEVGAINEFIRKENPRNRTLTPVFSHTYKYEIDFIQKLLPCDPFAIDSYYGFIHRQKSVLLYYGAGLEHTTFIHYIERIGKALLYRYDKVFSGIVETMDEKKLKTELVYHVRPAGMRLVYDWERLKKELIREGILFEWKFKDKRMSYCLIDRLAVFWLYQFNNNPYYFLDKETIKNIDPIIQKLGRKVLITDFEYNGRTRKIF